MLPRWSDSATLSLSKLRLPRTRQRRGTLGMRTRHKSRNEPVAETQRCPPMESCIRPQPTDQLERTFPAPKRIMHTGLLCLAIPNVMHDTLNKQSLASVGDGQTFPWVRMQGTTQTFTPAHSAPIYTMYLTRSQAVHERPRENSRVQLAVWPSSKHYWHPD
jgi:hypothetical protein